MNTLPSIAVHQALFTDHVPMLDVRAPIEFAQGAFPCATNLPLLNDQEREQIGICYKTHGQQAAIALGNELVSGDTKTTRLQAWADFIKANPNAMLYCFRGGLRSRTTQQWLHEAGIDIPLIDGGYKAMRRFLIDAIDTAASSKPFIIIGGATGSGKTLAIKALQRAVDLEACANHKGSSFGRPIDEQPSQIDFEHRVAIGLLQKHTDDAPLFLEDESQLIGRCAIPLSLRTAMQAAPRVLIEESIDSRAAIILQEYVIDQHAAFCQAFGEEDGAQHYQAALLGSLQRIQKRLGGERYAALNAIMVHALEQQLTHNRSDAHLEWIHALLLGYYDPMYHYQLSRHQAPVLFKGTRADVIDWCQQRENLT